jgi:PAS domain S-box-containing protein
MQQPTPTTMRLATLRIVAIYAFFGAIWILASDTVLGWMVTDPATLTRLAMFKGWLYVLLTSLLLYKLISRDSLMLAETSALLQASEERFHTIYDTLSDAVFIHDAETGRIVDVNDTMCRMYGYQRDEVLNQTIDLVGTGEAPYNASEALLRIQKTAAGTPQAFEWITSTKHGHRFWVEVSMRSATLDGHQRIVVMARDITDRKRAEELLNTQQTELEQWNRTLEQRVSETIAELRQKDELLLQQSRHAAMGEMLNNIAHQWRQPLNNIGIYVQNMQLLRAAGELTDEELQRDVQSVMDIIQYMSKTIDDFRTFFRNEKQKQPFAVKEAVEKTLRFVSARLEHHAITTQLVVRHESTLLGYQAEYIQVLVNIINNAVDALDQRQPSDRRITITLDQQDTRSLVTICDNGGGIPPTVLPHIFEPYFTTKGPSEGTGIGLYMSKVIIEKHMGGTLSARNTDDGAEFSVSIPV